MNRIQSLQFIRDNSRCIVSLYANKPEGTKEEIKWREQDEDFDKSIFEQRIGANGTMFMLHDFGKHGWDIYFISGGNETAKTIEQFCTITGCKTTA